MGLLVEDLLLLARLDQGRPLERDAGRPRGRGRRRAGRPLGHRPRPAGDVRASGCAGGAGRRGPAPAGGRQPPGQRPDPHPGRLRGPRPGPGPRRPGDPRGRRRGARTAPRRGGARLRALLPGRRRPDAHRARPQAAPAAPASACRSWPPSSPPTAARPRRRPTQRPGRLLPGGPADHSPAAGSGGGRELPAGHRRTRPGPRRPSRSRLGQEADSRASGLSWLGATRGAWTVDRIRLATCSASTPSASAS